MLRSLHPPAKVSQVVHDNRASAGYGGVQVGQALVYTVNQDVLSAHAGGERGPHLADAGTIHPQTVTLRPLSERNAQKRLAGISNACFTRIKVSQGALVRLDGSI